MRLDEKDLFRPKNVFSEAQLPMGARAPNAFARAACILCIAIYCGIGMFALSAIYSSQM